MKTLLRMIIAEIDFDKGEHEPYRIPWKYSFPRRTRGERPAGRRGAKRQWEGEQK